jgi:hypothetical protein
LKTACQKILESWKIMVLYIPHLLKNDVSSLILPRLSRYRFKEQSLLLLPMGWGGQLFHMEVPKISPVACDSREG